MGNVRLVDENISQEMRNATLKCQKSKYFSICAIAELHDCNILTWLALT